MKKLLLVLALAMTGCGLGAFNDNAKAPKVQTIAAPQPEIQRVEAGQVPPIGEGRKLRAIAGYTLVGTVPAATLSYTDATPAAGQVTSYEVTAVNSTGESAGSAPVTATTPSTAPPHSTTLGWSASPSTGSAAPANYNVYSQVVSVPPASLSTTTASLGPGTVGVAYVQPLAASGGTAPYTWTATGLPAGLAVSGSSIAGTPTAAGTFSVALKVADSEATPQSVSATLSLTVAAATVTKAPYNLTPSPTTFAFTGTAGGASPAAQTLHVSDSTPCSPLPAGVPVCHWPFTLSHSSSWLTVSPASGTTTATSSLSVNLAGLAAGTYTDTVVIAVTPQSNVTLSNSPYSIPVTLTVAPSSAITVTVTPSNGTVAAGQTLQMTATVAGTTNTAVTWKTTGGTISSSGLFTDSAAGQVTVTATSAANTAVSGHVVVTITAAPPPPPTLTGSCAAGAGLSFVCTFTPVNVPAGTAYSVTATTDSVSSTATGMVP